jgi:DNA polymerase
MGAGLTEFFALLDAVEDYYTTGEPRPAAARTQLRSGAGTLAEGGARPVAAPESTPVAGRVRAENATAGAPAAVAPVPAVPVGTVGAATSFLADVATEVASCRQCGLCETRTNTVPGEGASAPLVLVVGEGPGHDEDLSGRPFVGKAGKYLDRWLTAVGLNRTENAYIANVVKCRPPNNRDPAPAESAACMPFLQRQIAALRPQAILAVGRVASQVLTGSGLGIGAMRGQVYSYANANASAGGEAIPMVVTYHPSGVLRNPSLREPVWDDLRTLQRVLGTVSGPPDG